MSYTDQINIETTTALFNRHDFIYKHLISIGIEEVIPDSVDINLSIEIVIKLCTTPYIPIDSLLSSLKGYAELSLQEIADTISTLIDVGMLSYKNLKVSSVYQVPEEIALKLNSFSYPLPLVHEPNLLKQNVDSAYYTKQHCYSNITNIPKDIMELIDINLDHLNHINKTPLHLYPIDLYPEIPNQKEGEDGIEYSKKLTSLGKYIDASTDIHNLLSSYDTLYLSHYYDKRGRIYCKGYHLNYQGSDWNKAVLHIKGY
jgi:hypothetical protein